MSTYGDFVTAAARGGARRRARFGAEPSEESFIERYGAVIAIVAIVFAASSLSEGRGRLRSRAIRRAAGK